MLWFVGQSIVFLVLAFMLGVAVGWLLWARGAEPRERTVPFGVPHTPAATRVAPRPSSQSVDPRPEPVGAAPGVAVVTGAAAPLELAVLRPIEPHLVLRASAPAPPPDDVADLNGHTYEYAGDGDVVVEAVVVDLDPAPDEQDDATPPAAIDPDPTSLIPAVTAEPAPDPESEPADPPAEDRTIVLDPVVEQTSVLDLTALRDPEPEVVPDVVEQPDDLRKVEGIGPKISAALTAAGILTYRRLAEAGPEEITAALAAAGVRFAPTRATWAEQAKLLADGDAAALEELRARRVAARRTR